MQNINIPKLPIDELFEGLDLFLVRKNKIGIKDLEGNIVEENLENIINSDSYDGKTIVRSYSSGHIFLDDNNKKIFLITTEKNSIIQHQFTGGSPVEKENTEIFLKENGKYFLDLKKVKDNANIRTKTRAGVDVIENFNEKPIIDLVLLERNENGKNYYKMVYLFHFIVKKYDGILGFTGNENTIDGSWFNIDDLPITQYIAPNAFVVSKKAQEILLN